jgi:predicted membrane protein
MSTARTSRLTPKVIAGGILVLLGVLFILDNFGLVNAGDVWEYWPLILIAVGINHLARPRRRGQSLWGVLEILAGVFFLLRTLNIFWISFHKVWPVLLVVAGVYLIWETAVRRSAPLEASPPAPSAGERAYEGAMAGLDATRELREPVTIETELNDFALFGGGHRVVRSSDFRGGSVTAIAGGFDIDLREAQIAGDGARIEVFALMGGVGFRVPESWNVVFDVLPLLGGTGQRTRAPRVGEAPLKTLTISGVVIMGGIDIKN